MKLSNVKSWKSVEHSTHIVSVNPGAIFLLDVIVYGFDPDILYWPGE